MGTHTMKRINIAFRQDHIIIASMHAMGIVFVESTRQRLSAFSSDET